MTAQIPTQVTMTSQDGGHPFHHLKQEDLKNNLPSTMVSQTLKSTVVTTISGRTVFVPKK